MVLPVHGDKGKVVGFIDIGTNSIRLLLVRLHSNQSFTVLSQRKEVVRLGEGEFETQTLQRKPMQRAVLVCRMFRDMAESFDVDEIIAVATSATREAANRRKFLRMLQRETGLDVKVISGHEEARLIYLGVASGIKIDGQAFFIDIGGGSTEVVVGDQHTYSYIDSLRLGAIRLTHRFLENHTGPVSEEMYARIQNYVRDSSIRTLQELKNYPLDMAAGSSGTIENLADIAILAALGRRRMMDDVMTHKQLRRVVKMMCELPLEERRKVPGINPERADIIIAGAAIIDTFMEELGIHGIRISERGLRDGLLVEYLTRQSGQFPVELSYRAQSIIRLGRSQGFDEEHGRHIANLSLQLFDSSRQNGLHSLGDHERELLEFSALLHDVGVSLSYANHQAHSYYFIRNAELLGFDETEVSIMAATTLFHRKRFPRKKHPEFASLGKRARRVVRSLSVFLGIAESLDRSHQQLIREVNLEPVGEDKALLTLYSSQEIPLEMWGVEYHRSAFRQVFKRKLKVRRFELSAESEGADEPGVTAQS
jgi:exopolyphosphatase / guanosine-5'-triphosphate,3'-diphosphate pyrophosphatase